MSSESVAPSPHTLTADEILALDRIPAGTIRSHVLRPDGIIESTAVNNLLAIHGTFCADFIMNRFGSYIVIPPSFWQYVKKDLGEYHGRDWRLLAKNEHGGYMGIISESTIYVAKTDVVVLKPDQGSLVFEFNIGPTHEITLSKETLIKTYGYEKVGYDTRLPYVPWWRDAYAPVPLLLEWAAYDGFKPAVKLLDDPPQAALDQWYNQGQIAAPTRDAVQRFITSGTTHPQLTGTIIDV